jgi:hypothetical protein
LSDANKRAASAFGHTGPQKVFKPMSSPAGVAAMGAVPRVGYEAARSSGREKERESNREEQADDETQETTPSTPADVIAEGKARKPAPAPKKYALTAVGKDGHTIGTDNGIEWFDVQTGEPIKPSAKKEVK